MPFKVGLKELPQVLILLVAASRAATTKAATLKVVLLRVIRAQPVRAMAKVMVLRVPHREMGRITPSKVESWALALARVSINRAAARKLALPVVINRAMVSRAMASQLIRSKVTDSQERINRAGS